MMEFFTTGEALVKVGWTTLEGSVRRHTSLAASMVGQQQVHQADLKCWLDTENINPLTNQGKDTQGPEMSRTNHLLVDRGNKATLKT